MIDLKITTRSNKEFAAYAPASLQYTMSFRMKADFLTYDALFAEPLKYEPDEEYTLEVTPTNGTGFKFTGILYEVKQDATNPMRKRLYFVSKYLLGLQSTPAMYGGGLSTDIMSSLYSQIGVPRVEKQDGDVNFESLLFPRTTTVDEALTYLLNRATIQPRYFESTIIQDAAYVRDVTNAAKSITGNTYVIRSVMDKRKKVDAEGGLLLTMRSDVTDINDIEIKQDGTAQIEQTRFVQSSNKQKDRAFVNIKQQRSYYNSYGATITFPEWQVYIGRDLRIDANDPYQNTPTPVKALERGRYFVNTQILDVDFTRGTTQNTCNVQWVGAL